MTRDPTRPDPTKIVDPLTRWFEDPVQTLLRACCDNSNRVYLSLRHNRRFHRNAYVNINHHRTFFTNFFTIY